ncbi:condensation domain-containing protein, partial [Streptomyces sp. wa22]|uniref:condensation domain-containing protein n=1 Tax=Streptomyces sp. wa22 TaxID=1828244 RepID=UPI001C9C925F
MFGTAGEVHEITVPEPLTRRLSRLRRLAAATLFMTLVAASQLLFARYSGQGDIAVGSVTPPAVFGTAGEVHEITVPEPLTRRLTELGARNGSTLFMTLVAASQLLFARYSGQGDIAVGSVTAGRGRAELDDLIGYFSDTVILRSQVDESRSFTADGSSMLFSPIQRCGSG